MAMAKRQYHCWEHNLLYSEETAFELHLKNECQQMLNDKRNVCLYLQNDGKCCQPSFKMTTSLIIHYMREHRLFACTHCYRTFSKEQDLEEHDHTEGINLCLRPFKCRRCPTSWPNERTRRSHDTASHKKNYDAKSIPVLTEFCPHCTKGYTATSSLYRHLRKKYGIETIDSPKKPKM